jgi:hypothetical protein
VNVVGFSSDSSFLAVGTELERSMDVVRGSIEVVCAGRFKLQQRAIFLPLPLDTIGAAVKLALRPLDVYILCHSINRFESSTAR